MSNRLSVATISSPEFINIEGVSPFAAKCEIKVLYLGGNRNGSFIDKDTAVQMAQTLPGCPIVGYYSENAEDFRDHGDQMIIDGDGIKFNCLTTPYGFVAPNSRVWFQDFEDTDEFGNSVVRTYLMTEGYLWVEQYKEAQKVINEGRPQSMELDEKTLKGHWSTDVNRGIDFFIINDAIFSKLCILGEDVEPCFEGANVTAPKVSSTFTKDEKFTQTLFDMMKELKELTLLTNKEGGNLMNGQNTDFVAVNGGEPEVTTATAEPVVATEPIPAEPVIIQPVVKEDNLEISSNSQDKIDLDNINENDNTLEEFAKKNPEEDEDEEKKDGEQTPGDENGEKDDEQKKKTSKNSLEEKYALLEQQFNDLQDKCSKLEEANASLVAFKAEVEDKEKDALINSFYMLSDEDKKEVIENKSKYTLDDIEKELSVICVRKKVNFNLDEEDNKEVNETVPTTFNIDSNVGDDLPAWLKAVESRRNENN